jgi:hypothetical protein
MEVFVRFGFGGEPSQLQKALGRIDEYLGRTGVLGRGEGLGRGNWI